jgi:hypothetical protein
MAGNSSMKIYRPKNRYKGSATTKPKMFAAMVLICLLPAAGCITTTPNPPAEVVNKTGALISEKDKAQQWARILKREHSSDGEKEILNKGRGFYIDASTDFNGIVGDLEIRVSNKIPIDSDNFQGQVKIAISKAEIFDDYVKSLKSGQTMDPATITAIVNQLVPAVWTNITQIYGFVKKEHGESRDRLLKSIDDLKWLAFDNISTNEPPATEANAASKPK